MNGQWLKATSDGYPSQLWNDEAGNYIQYRNINYVDDHYEFEYRYLNHDEAVQIGVIMETAAQLIPTIVKMQSAEEACTILFGTNDADVDFVAQARTLRPMLAEMAVSLSDDEASSVPFLFEQWNPNGHSYAVDDRVQYNGTLYRCIQAHTSLSTWDPVHAPSLWARTDDPAIEWPEWVRPLGTHDAYAKGAKVSHNGKHWISNTPNNTWEPGVYGWDEVPEATE